MKVDIVRMHTLVLLYVQESLILSTRVSAAGILRENSLLSHGVVQNSPGKNITSIYDTSRIIIMIPPLTYT